MALSRLLLPIAAGLLIAAMRCSNLTPEGVTRSENSKSAGKVAAMGKVFWNSENNDIDGPVWPDKKHATAIKWLANVLTNYASFNMTATIICPLFHGWTMQYGRQ